MDHIPTFGSRLHWKELIDYFRDVSPKHATLMSLEYCPYYTFFVCRFTQNSSNTLWPIGRNFLKHILANLYCPKCNEISMYFILRCTVACFIYIIAQKILHILWSMFWNGWKCIFNCFTWFLTLSNKVKKCLVIRFLVCLSTPVSARSNFRKYSSNVLKFIHAVHIWCRIDNTENDMHGTKCSFAETPKIFRYISTYQWVEWSFKYYCNICI